MVNRCTSYRAEYRSLKNFKMQEKRGFGRWGRGGTNWGINRADLLRNRPGASPTEGLGGDLSCFDYARMDGNNLQLRLDRCGAFAVPLMAAAKVRRI